MPYAAGLATAAAAAWFFAFPHGGVPAGAAPPGPLPAPGPARGPVSSALPASTAPSPAVARDGDGFPSAPGRLRAGEGVLEFRDADRGVIRKFLLPEGVDPGKLELVDDRRVIRVEDEQGVR